MQEFVVGAYAAMSSEASDQTDFYDALAASGYVTGIEIPFRGPDPDHVLRVANGLRFRFPASIVTTIPGVMGRLAIDPDFGLASVDPSGRARAIDYLLDVRDMIGRVEDLVGYPTIMGVHVQSAPSRMADPDAFLESMAQIAGWDWHGATPIIEHCDAEESAFPGEKNFLTVEQEIAIARELELRLAINWGRSALEGHDAALPAEHVRAAHDAGVLAGVMFSGAGGVDCDYGGAWMDLHLPLTEDEPASAMDTARVEETLAAGGRDALYLGAKIQTPLGATVDERMEMIGHIHRAATAEAVALP